LGILTGRGFISHCYDAESQALVPGEDVMREVWFALRALRKAPGYSLGAGLTLALAIGAFLSACLVTETRCRNIWSAT